MAAACPACQEVSGKGWVDGQAGTERQRCRRADSCCSMQQSWQASRRAVTAYTLQEPHTALLTLPGLWSGRRLCASPPPALPGPAAATATSLGRHAFRAAGRAVSDSEAWRGRGTGRTYVTWAHWLAWPPGSQAVCKARLHTAVGEKASTWSQLSPTSPNHLCTAPVPYSGAKCLASALHRTAPFGKPATPQAAPAAAAMAAAFSNCRLMSASGSSHPQSGGQAAARRRPRSVPCTAAPGDGLRGSGSWTPSDPDRQRSVRASLGPGFKAVETAALGNALGMFLGAWP